MVLGQDCYDIHHPFEFNRSKDKAAPWAVISKIGWALNAPLPVKQTAPLATTATSIADEKLANQLSKWRDIESYASNCDVTGPSKEEQRAIKTLEEQTTRNNFYSAMRQLNSPEWRLQKDETLGERYHETIVTRTSTSVTCGKFTIPNWMKQNTNCSGIYCIILSSTLSNPRKSEECAKQQQSTKV